MITNYYYKFFVSLGMTHFYPGTQEPIHHAIDGTEVGIALYTIHVTALLNHPDLVGGKSTDSQTGSTGSDSMTSPHTDDVLIADVASDEPAPAPPPDEQPRRRSTRKTK